MEDEKRVIAEGDVVSLEYTLRVDGEVVDTSEGGEPIEFIQGSGQIIPGLEKELYGMSLGDDKQVVVGAADGYGELDPEAVMTFPKSDFPDNIPMQPGTELQLRDNQGRVYNARIVAIEGDEVRLDFNHPLAGKELTFDVKVVGLRAATDEELTHGHVHGPEGH